MCQDSSMLMTSYFAVSNGGYVGYTTYLNTYK
jgi:hypothetical protein